MLLMLIRHAQTENTYSTDYNRILSRQGRNEFLQNCQQHYLILQSIDCILCSTAIRARQTCGILLSVLEQVVPVYYEEKLYSTDINQIFLVRDIIHSYAQQGYTHIAVIGHAQWIHQLATGLLGKEYFMRRGEIITCEWSI